MDIQKAINNIINNINLSREDMHSIMHTIMSGEATPAQIAGFLVALRIKGETVDEITGAAEVMRELATKVDVDKGFLSNVMNTSKKLNNLCFHVFLWSNITKNQLKSSESFTR